MSVLEIGPEKAKNMSKLEDSALKILQEYFDGERQGGDDVVAARCVLNVVKGNRQTQTVRETLNYNMVSDLEDPKLRKKYISATQPEIKKLMKGS